jgi:hypothetical protein
MQPAHMLNHTSRVARMRRVRSVMGTAFICLALLGGCRLQRPDQDNFLVDASRVGGSALARSLSTSLHADLEAQEVNLPRADKSTLYRLEGSDFALIVNPLPDDRCNVNASNHSTFYQKQYRLDLVYRTTSREVRMTIRRNLMNSVARLNLPIEEFKGC